MPNKTLLFRELRGLWKLLLIFGGILTLYITMIISMYDPAVIGSIRQFQESMPELMAIVGMTGTMGTLLEFMTSYLYGFLLLVFPMVFSIFCAYRLVGKYIDNGSLVFLLSAPVRRRTVIITEITAAFSGLFLLLFFVTALEIFCAQIQFPEEICISGLLLINFGLLGLHLFILGIGIICAVSFNDLKGSIGAGAGIPALSYVITMLGNAGEKTEIFRYISFFSLYDPSGLISGEAQASIGIGILYAGSFLLLGLSVLIFSKRDFSL